MSLAMFDDAQDARFEHFLALASEVDKMRNVKYVVICVALYCSDVKYVVICVALYCSDVKYVVICVALYCSDVK